MGGENVEYDASQIQVLHWPEMVRVQPGRYVGSTGERGLRQLVFCVADEMVTEVLGGRGTAVDITLTADGAVRVSDDGPGVPDLEAALTDTLASWGRGGRSDVRLRMFGMG